MISTHSIFASVTLPFRKWNSLLLGVGILLTCSPDTFAADRTDSKTVREPDACRELARRVASEITALGNNPPADAVASIISKAVFQDPQCAPAIVNAAVKAAPAGLAETIVEAAIASVPNPEQLVYWSSYADGKSSVPQNVAGNMPLAEAILNSAIEARPGLDAVALAGAADRGLQANLATQLALASPGSPRGGQSFGGLNRYEFNPNLAAKKEKEKKDKEKKEKKDKTPDDNPPSP